MCLSLVAACASAGCGRTSTESQTPAEQTKAKIKDLQEQHDELQAKYDQLSREYDTVENKAQRLRNQAINLISSGDIQGGKDLSKQANELDDSVRSNYTEMNSLMKQMNDLLDQMDTAETKRESQLGCDKSCRANRDRLSNLYIKCVTRLMRAGATVDQEMAVCGKRYAMPPLPGQ